MRSLQFAILSLGLCCLASCGRFGSGGSALVGTHAPAIDLASAVRTVTKAPAEAVGLTDRGEIAVGKRADLIRVRVAGEVPVVRSVWREGLRVA